MKCLIVDDESTARKLIEIHLSQYGTCFTAVSGLLAVQTARRSLAEREPYDLICLDIMMPGMDGHETLSAIREMEKEYGIAPDARAKVIMITALADADHISQAFRSGAESYIIKPVTEEKLTKELAKLGLTEPVQTADED